MHILIIVQYVDEVIIGAPYSVTEDILNKEYNVSVVIHGTTSSELDIDGADPYEVRPSYNRKVFIFKSLSQLPKSRGIYREISSPNSTLTTQGIIDRIIENRFM